MPLVKIMPGGVFGHQMSLESFVTLAPISAPTCVSVCIWAPQGWGGVTFYQAKPRFTPAARLQGPWYFANNLPSMCLSLLDQAEWKRQSGKESRYNSASPHVWSPQIQMDCRHCGDVHSCVRTCLSGTQRWQQRTDANRGYGLTYTQTHNLIDIKKQSILGSIVSNVFNVNGTPGGHVLLC